MRILWNIVFSYCCLFLPMTFLLRAAIATPIGGVDATVQLLQGAARAEVSTGAITADKKPSFRRRRPGIRRKQLWTQRNGKRSDRLAAFPIAADLFSVFSDAHSSSPTLRAAFASSLSLNYYMRIGERKHPQNDGLC